MKGLRRFAERLCRTVAPDVPVTVLLASDLRGLLPLAAVLGRGALGATAPYLGSALRPVLERHAPRVGHPAAALVLDPARIAAACGDSRAQRRRHFRTVFAGVLLHELAHAVLFQRGEQRREPRPEYLEAARESLVAAFADAMPPASYPWVTHDASFIRVALHLAHRVERAGCDVRPWDVVDASAYGLSDTIRYWRALGAERDDLIGQPITEVAALPAPIGMRALFRRDTRHYRRQHRRTRAAAGGRANTTP